MQDVFGGEDSVPDKWQTRREAGAQSHGSGHPDGRAAEGTEGQRGPPTKEGDLYAPQD